MLLLHRAPDNPHQQIIKRLLAVEGDTILEDMDSKQVVEIAQVGWASTASGVAGFDSAATASGCWSAIQSAAAAV
jgi:hypothetical protein